MMAASDKPSVKSSAENLCKACSKATKSGIKCTVCESAFHASCAVRITGVRVTGYNELCCSKCSAPDDAGESEFTNQCESRLLKTNETLNAVILQLMEDRDLLKIELQDIMEKLCELTLNSRKPEMSRQELHRKISKTSMSRQTGTETEPQNVGYSVTEPSIIPERESGATSGNREDQRRQRRSHTSGEDDTHGDSHSKAEAECQRQPRMSTVGAVISNDKLRADAAPADCRDRTQCDIGAKQNGRNSQFVDPKRAYAAIHEEATRRMAQEIIDLGSAEGTSDNDGWKTVNKNRRRNRARDKLVSRTASDCAIIGASQQSSKLKSVPKTVSLYITRLTPNTSAADIEEQLKERSPEAKAVEMFSKFPDIYKSFKVTINIDNYDSVMTPEAWPTGVRVDKFFHWRVKKQTTA